MEQEKIKKLKTYEEVFKNKTEKEKAEFIKEYKKTLKPKSNKEIFKTINKIITGELNKK